jgi:hypothetical protein
LAWLLLGLAVLAIVLCTQLPKGHFTRVAAAALALAIGAGAALSAARNCRWRVRLAWLGAGLAGAAAAWVFVPTTQGLSLWTAHAQTERQESELERLQAGDTASFSREAEDRIRLTKQFPSFQPRIQRAERAWLERSAARWEDSLKKLAPADAEGFRKEQTWGRQLNILLATRMDAPAREKLRTRLEQAENVWLERSVARWEKDLKMLPVQDSKRFLSIHHAAHEVFDQSNLPLPGAPLSERVAKAEKDWFGRTFASLRPGDYEAARKAREYCPAELREGDWLPSLEGAWAGRTADAVVQKVQPLLATNPLQASSLLSQAAKDLAGFGNFAAVQDRLRKHRRLAVAGRVKAAQTEFKEWIKANRDEEINDVADRLVKDIAQEAREVDLEKPLKDFCASCRAWAELAGKAKYWEWTEHLDLISAFPQPGMPATLSLRAAWIQRGPRRPPDQDAR